MESLSSPNSPTSQYSPFGVHGAATFDSDATRMPNRYKDAHAIQNELVVNALEGGATDEANVVVDLGSGTANDGVDILNQSDQAFYLGIDSSYPMIERAKEKMHLYGYARRSVFLHNSFCTMTASDVSRTLQGEHLDGKITVVMSALALHHYELTEKRAVYRLAYDLLYKGGIFVLTDLFSNGFPDCARHALSREIDDIRSSIKQFDRDPIAPQEATTLSVDHYIQYNKPQNLLLELALLHDIGFGNSDVVYRYGQLAVIVSERGE